MLFRMLLLFTVLPLTELYVLLWVKDQTSFAFTMGLVLATGVIGASLARWQGLQALFRIREEMAAGRLPAAALGDGVMILLAGAVLITPGILTDICGFLLLIPPARRLLARGLRHWARSRFVVHQFQQTQSWPPQTDSDQDRIVDAHVVSTSDVKDSRAESDTRSPGG